MPLRRAYFDLDWGQLHYRHNGRTQLTPLVLLHQTPSDSRMYTALAAELDESFWLIIPDNPGFGGSDPLPAGFTMAGCGEAILQLLQHLDISRCLLFGHHTGASIAVQMAASQPALVIAMALGGPPLLDDALRAALPGKAAPLPVQADGSHLLGMWQRMSGKEAAAPGELLLREVCAAFAAGPAYQQAYQSVVEQDFAGQLAAVAVPVLVFAGSGDILHGRLAPAFELLQQGQMVELPGVGGYVCDLQAGQVAALLRDFFGAA